MAPRSRPHYTVRRDIPPGVHELACTRTAFLFEVMRYGTSMRDVLASAWLQGIEDAAQTIRHRMPDTTRESTVID